MSYLFRKFAFNNAKSVIIKHEPQLLLIMCRQLSIVPSYYDGSTQDPAPKFFSSNVQSILKRLTRPDPDKVFRKRTNSGYQVLRTPKYKFLTDEELQAELKQAEEKADRLLQMPPVIQIHKPIDDVLSKDPALVGYDASTYLFTDISFGVDNEHRIIIQRDPDGTLKSCDHDLRKRLNQVYFPMHGRKLKEPLMFTDEEKLNALLENQKYEFILDRACIQYEPDEPAYQKITSITYQHVDSKRTYDLLRSSRHFGPMAFYLTWQHSADGLMLELVQGGAVREGALLAALRRELHDEPTAAPAPHLVQQILATPVQLTKMERLTEKDIQLDNKCVECIEQYIANNSAMKSQQELALQGFKEYYQQLIELSRGLQKAHGNV